MGLYGKENLFNRMEYKDMELHDTVNKQFENKIGLFDRGDELFSNVGIFERVNAWRKARRKQKLVKALKEIVNEVNTVPRGLGTLPETKNISMNGYFNYKYPNLQGLENTTIAKVLGTGNDHETNVRLYAKAMQLIDDSFYDCRHLYKGDPELEAIAEKVRTNLEKREKYENHLRVKGYQEDIAQKTRALDEKFGAITPDWRYKEMAKSGIASVLEQAEKDLGESLNTKGKKQLHETMERLKVYLAREDLYFVPRKEIVEYRNNDPQTRPFEERVQDFIEKYTPTQDENREILEDSPTQKTFEQSRESLDVFTRRALAEDKLAKETTGIKNTKQISTPPRDEVERC